MPTIRESLYSLLEPRFRAIAHMDGSIENRLLVYWFENWEILELQWRNDDL